jgi:hypothetical protein
MAHLRFIIAIIFGLFAVYRLWIAASVLRPSRAHKTSFDSRQTASSRGSYDYAYTAAYNTGLAIFAGSIAAMLIFVWS